MYPPCKAVHRSRSVTFQYSCHMGEKKTRISPKFCRETSCETPDGPNKKFARGVSQGKTTTLINAFTLSLRQTLGWPYLTIFQVIVIGFLSWEKSGWFISSSLLFPTLGFSQFLLRQMLMWTLLLAQKVQTEPLMTMDTFSLTTLTLHGSGLEPRLPQVWTKLGGRI